jgi:hypothetical protein
MDEELPHELHLLKQTRRDQAEYEIAAAGVALNRARARVAQDGYCVVPQRIPTTNDRDELAGQLASESKRMVTKVADIEKSMSELAAAEAAGDECVTRLLADHVPVAVGVDAEYLHKAIANYAESTCFVRDQIGTESKTHQVQKITMTVDLRTFSDFHQYQASRKLRDAKKARKEKKKTGAAAATAGKRDASSSSQNSSM